MTSQITARDRLLVLTPRFPYPVVGGDRLRIYQLCKELAKYFDLTLLSLCDSDSEMEYADPGDGVFATVHRVYLSKWRSVLSVIQALPTDTPLQVAYYRSAEFRNKLNELIPHHKGCVAHLIRTGDYLLDASAGVNVLEMTDAISLNYHRISSLGAGRSFKEWVYRLEAKRLLKYERNVLGKFDLVTLVSGTDRDFLLAGRSLDNVLVCSNGVDLDAFPFSFEEETKPVVAYIGNMLSVQNLDACLYFIEEVMPLFNADEVVFRVVGNISAADAAKLSSHSGVEVTGRVDDILSAVRDARVGVCPVRMAAGVQNKVLEYMALGLPVITSEIGLEGFEARADEDVLVARSPEDYVSHVRRLWADGGLRRKLALNGRDYVERKHVWSAQLSPLVSRLANKLS